MTDTAFPSNFNFARVDYSLYWNFNLLFGFLFLHDFLIYTGHGETRFNSFSASMKH